MANDDHRHTRAGALAALVTGYDSARAGAGAISIVAGEAGVGKTWLARTFLRAPATADATVLAGGCVDVRQGGPSYWPIVEAVRSLLRDSSPEQLADLLGPLEPELRRLLPGLTGEDGPQPASRGGASQYRLYEVLLDLLERLSSSGPVVVLIEDLHWADQSTRDLLGFLAANLARLPILLIGTYRTDELLPGHPLHSLLAELYRLREVSLVELERLTKPELAGMLKDTLGMKPRSEVLEEIWLRSDGNPFFAQELLAGVLAGEPQMPATLRQILHARLARLPPAALQILRMAHVAGGTAAHELLAAMGTLGERELLDALRSCVINNILIVDTELAGYGFRHSLLREAVDEDLLPGERTALHLACARALEADRSLALGSAPIELARHWYEAGCKDEALPAAVTAAAAAESSFGYAEALTQYERALELTEELGEHRAGAQLLDLLERAAECANLAGDHERASVLAEQAAERCSGSSDAARAALIWERRGRYLADAGASEDALGACRRAVDLMPAQPERAEVAQVLGTYAETLMLSGRYRRARREAEQALALARRTGGRGEEARVLGILGFIVAYLGDGDSVHLLQSALDIAEEDGEPDDVARVYVHLTGLLSGPLNRLGESIEVAQKGLRRVRVLGLERTHGVTLQSGIVNTLFRMGRWNEADTWVRSALESKPQGAAAIDLYLARAKILIGRGDLDTAASDLSRARALSIRAVDPRYRAPLATLEAGLALWRGDLEAARSAVDTGLARLTASEEVWFTAPLVWHGARVEADAAEQSPAGRDDTERRRSAMAGEALLLRLEGLTERVAEASQPIRASVAAYGAMCRGELARLEGGATEPWEEAAQAWDRMDHPYPAAYCRFRLAEALLGRRNRSARVAELLRRAASTAAGLGAEPFGQAVETLIRRSGLSPAELKPGSSESSEEEPRKAAVERLGLTPREIEVLCLLAEGSTNREVAQTLFISEKTAGVHVSHILTKLGLRNRSQAGALAHKLDIVTPTESLAGGEHK